MVRQDEPCEQEVEEGDQGVKEVELEVPVYLDDEAEGVEACQPECLAGRDVEEDN